MVAHHDDFNNGNGAAGLLDLFSISQTKTPQCTYYAPIICTPPTEQKAGFLYQACCNHWDCERCGYLRACYEYGRIVEGCKKLSPPHDLYFTTITCQGRTLTLKDAEANYLEWTNRLLTNYRTHVNRAGGHWAYVGLTERQPKRKHPHTHYIMTCKPTDAFFIRNDYQRYVREVEKIGRLFPAMKYYPETADKISDLDLWSTWFVKACGNSGLGIQTRISLVDNPEATAKYVSKYMFKQLGQDDWGRHWRRVRYSQNFPVLPDRSNPDAFPLLNKADWERAAGFEGEYLTHDNLIVEMALHRNVDNVRITHTPERDKNYKAKKKAQGKT